MEGLENGRWFGATRGSSRRTPFRSSEVLEARGIFINIGGRATVPPMQGLDQVPYLTNS